MAHNKKSWTKYKMKRMKGGVALINLRDRPSVNMLEGDILSFEDGEYDVKLRGTEQVIRLSPENLVELSQQSDSHRDGEFIRCALLEAARSEPDAQWLREAVQAMELSEQFTYLILSNTNPVGFDPLPDEVQRQALVRYLGAKYFGRRAICTRGRDMTSFYLALSPFFSHKGGGSFETFQGQHRLTTGGVITWCQQLFADSSQSGKLDASLIFRAYSFVESRKDFRKPGDLLLDAFCVAFCVIQVLQGHRLGTLQIREPVLEEFRRYGMQTFDLQLDHVLWCFCQSLLSLGIVVRDMVDTPSFNLLLPEPYGATVAEMAAIPRLMIQLRPNSPSSYLSAYIFFMDTKDLAVSAEHMLSAHEMAMAGMNMAEEIGDPLYKYLFHMIVAYWMPTTANGTAVTAREVRSRVCMANDFKNRCRPYTPEFLFFQGKQHEGALLAMIKAFDVPDDMFLSQLDPYTYSSVRFVSNNKYYKPGGKFDRLKQRYHCANCSKQLAHVKFCMRCCKVAYCGKQCQTEHWKKYHKASCKPKKK